MHVLLLTCTSTAAALFTVLVTWRSRRVTAIRFVAPFVFLLLALIINLALDANNQLQSRVAAVYSATPQAVSSIPDCTQDLYIGSKPCVTFVWTPNTDPVVQVSCFDMQGNCEGSASVKQMQFTPVLRMVVVACY